MPKKTPEVVTEKTQPKKHAGGRPTKYKPEFCDMLIEFFDQPFYEDVKIPHYRKGEVHWEDIKRMPNKLPTMVEFVKWLRKEKGVLVSYSAIYDWLDQKNGAFQQMFLQTFKRICKPLQQNFLVQNALQGLYNPLFAKFTAINITDMKDAPLIDNSKHLTISYDYRNSHSKDSAVRPERRGSQSSESNATESLGLGRQGTRDATEKA